MGKKNTLFKKISKFLNNSEKEETKIVIPSFSVECKNEDEFRQRMLLKIGGPHVKLAIIQQPDKHTQEEIEYERRVVEDVGGTLKVPSLVSPINRSIGNFVPYITIFMYDGRLFVYPYDSDTFSDILKEEERE